MKLTVKMKLNQKHEVVGEFEGADITEAIKKAGVFLDNGGECGLCKGTDLTLRTRSIPSEGISYTEYVCLSCGATRNFGAYKDKSGFFLKEWKEAYKKA